MNAQNDITPRQSGISGETALAIISVTLAALWIAFAFYHGTSSDANGNRILLLHPLVPIALIALLIRIYRWVGIKFVVHLEITMIGLWLFVKLLGILMPFILGFGFAYLFRFLWRALPFKKYYQRAIATVLIVLVCSGVLIFTGIGVGNQVSQMAKGLQKFYHESLLPLIVGEDFTALAFDKSGETQTLYLATNHGIYFYKTVMDAETEKEIIEDRKGITNGEIIGKKIRAISVNNDYIYAGTDDGVYRCNKKIVQVVTGKKDDSSESTSRIGFLRKFWHVVIGKKKESTDLEWTKIKANKFDTRSVQAINTPSWNSNIIYVGTDKGLFFSENSGDTWVEEESNKIVGRSIVDITSIEKYEGASDDIPKYFERKDIPMYVATIENTDQTISQPKQEDDINTNDYQNGGDQESIEPQIPTTQETNSEKTEDPNKIKTVVYKRTNPSGEWNKLSFDKDPGQINVLVATDNKAEELYAGTVNGIYRWYKLNKTGQRIQSSDQLPRSISLLVSAPSGLYAGNESVIYFGSDESNEIKIWKSSIIKENGILAYRDEEIVRQFQEYLTKRIPGWTASGGAFVKWLSGLAGSIAFQFGGLIATVFLAFIVFVYASQGFDKYFRGFIGLVPEKHRETAMAYLREIDRNMHQFLKGQFIVIVIISIISCIVYRIIGVPFALLVGILAGLCNAIPTFGPFIGGGFAYIAMLMGLAAGEFSLNIGFLVRCVFVLGAILGIQTIDNSIISPKVMSNAVDVDPLLIMFAVIVGASILGFWGVLLAIPIIVVIKSIVAVSKTTANGTDTQPAQEQP
ncbi:MAG: AI-2E family transporter [Candidatus Poribacteria bacterium]|nr:AI-2E family transporter [Candidatus Poribacteria bacterium]